MGGVHVHQHQAVLVLREDINAVQLRQRETQWRKLITRPGPPDKPFRRPPRAHPLVGRIPAAHSFVSVQRH